jgi:hypothetical protein
MNPSRRLFGIVAAWLAFSAALTWWITHDHHVLVRKIDYRPARPRETFLDREMLVYCPICGEPMRMDQTPLSLQVDDGYRTHAHSQVRSDDIPEWKHDED